LTVDTEAFANVEVARVRDLARRVAEKASDVVLPPDTAAMERHLEEGTRKLRGCCYQIVLRSVTTLGGHPRRLHEWVRIATGAAERNS